MTKVLIGAGLVGGAAWYGRGRGPVPRKWITDCSEALLFYYHKADQMETERLRLERKLLGKRRGKKRTRK